MRKKAVELTIQEKIEILIIWSVRAVVALSISLGLIRGDWELFFISILGLILTFIPELIEKSYKVRLPVELDIIMVLFIAASIMLGSLGGAYNTFWWWDIMLHITSGFILAYAGFLTLYVMYYRRKLQAGPRLIALLTFCVGIAFGAVWEIFEFGVDHFFGTNMQRNLTANGLQDTMSDLIVDAIGSLAVAISGYFFIRGSDRPTLTARLTKRFLKLNPSIANSRWWDK